MFSVHNKVWVVIRDLERLTFKEFRSPAVESMGVLLWHGRCSVVWTVPFCKADGLPLLTELDLSLWKRIGWCDVNVNPLFTERRLQCKINLFGGVWHNYRCHVLSELDVVFYHQVFEWGGLGGRHKECDCWESFHLGFLKFIIICKICSAHKGFILINCCKSLS